MNTDLLSKVLIFATGVAIGSVASWQLLKTKYEQISREEIESVKAAFSRKEKDIEKENDKTYNDSSESVDGKKYEQIIKDNGYMNYSGVDTKEVDDMEKPYVIPPEEYGELDDYETIELTYYADGILTDDRDDIIDDDIDNIVGDDFADHFGEYEDDSVFIRNDRLKCDYAIQRELETYRNTHYMED